MNAEVERRIRAAYPKGYIELLDVNACDFSYIEPVALTLKSRLGRVGAGLDRLATWPSSGRVGSGHIGLCAADGTFWNSEQTNTNHLHQRLAETNAPGIVCILTVSTVFPAWDCFFNLWSARVNPAPNDAYADHMVCESFNESDIPAAWAPIMQEISDCCALHGLVRFEKEELMKELPFVTQSIHFAEDDDKDVEYNEEYDGFTPSATQQVCNVGECLFQSY